MSRNYKFYNNEGLYFVSFATINWIDVFVRDEYFMALVSSLAWCRKEKSMEIYSWCIMPSHVHLVFRAKDANPSSPQPRATPCSIELVEGVLVP